MEVAVATVTGLGAALGAALLGIGTLATLTADEPNLCRMTYMHPA